MTRRFVSKEAARQAVWDALQARNVARFPFPPHGRIPSFEMIEVMSPRPAPCAIDWSLLAEDDIEAMPILKELKHDR